VTDFLVRQTCQSCGADTEPAAIGRVLRGPGGAGCAVNAIVRCTECGHQFLLSLRMDPASVDRRIAHREADARRRRTAGVS
jgi:uncharacterized Zn finger protein